MDIALFLIVVILLTISTYFMYAYFTCPTIGLEDNDPDCAPSTKTVGSCVVGWWNLWGSCRAQYAGLEGYRTKKSRRKLPKNSYKKRYTPVNTAMSTYIKPIPAVQPVPPTAQVSTYLPITQANIAYPYNKFTWPSV
jgi:hypothetical protein